MIPDNTSRKTTSVQRARSLQYCRGRCLGSAARDAKKNASRTATLACRPSYSTVLLFYCFPISLQIQYCRGRCLGLAARDAKMFSTYYHVLPHILPRTTAERSFCISDSPLATSLSLPFFREGEGRGSDPLPPALNVPPIVWGGQVRTQIRGKLEDSARRQRLSTSQHHKVFPRVDQSQLQDRPLVLLLSHLQTLTVSTTAFFFTNTRSSASRTSEL